jgi:glycosyltransferase involved in cell wall biosynthesis
MRILFVISGLGLGGAERQVALLASEFIRLGHAVGVYTLNRELARADELEGSGVELIVDAKRRRFDPALLSRLRRHVQHWRPDVVHGVLYDGNLYTRLAAAGLGLPVINSERNDDYRLSAAQALGYRLSGWLFDAVVANSHAGAAFARSLHRIAAPDVHVVWNGIDLDEIDARLARAVPVAHQLWPGDELKRLCVVGSIKPQKDHALALQVMRSLVDADPTWRLLCVGDELSGAGAPLKQDLLAQCAQLGLQAQVRFVGHRRDVPEVIASCDALLVTSRHEGFPNVVLEAMACGTPVASTAYSDVRRILPQPWQVCDDRSPQALAAAVVRCVAERDAVVARQRAWVEAHATAAASAKAMLAVYATYSRAQPALARSVS